MAGDWIKMRCGLHEDPRVVELASLLNVEALHAIGMLWRVWSWADQQSLDGNAVSVTENYLDHLVSRDGFAVALRKVGWLEGRDRALTFPRFAEHNGQTAKSRSVTRNRVEKHRGQKCNADTVTPVTPGALPEKRREEYINTLPNPPSLADQPPEPPAEANRRERERTFPASLNTAAFRDAWDRWLTYWAEAFRRVIPSATADAHLGLCLKLGPILAVQAIDNAIARGLREPSTPNQPTSPRKPEPPRSKPAF